MYNELMIIATFLCSRGESWLLNTSYLSFIAAYQGTCIFVARRLLPQAAAFRQGLYGGRWFRRICRRRVLGGVDAACPVVSRGEIAAAFSTVATWFVVIRTVIAAAQTRTITAAARVVVRIAYR